MIAVINHPTPPDVMQALEAALGDELARVLDWTVRASVEEMLRAQNHSVHRYRGSVRREAAESQVIWQEGGRHYLRGQNDACNGLQTAISRINTRDIVQRVAHRMNAVRLRREAQIVPWKHAA